MMNNSNFRKRWYLIFLFPLMFFILAGVVMYLWNAILPDVARLGVISYWQSAGLLLLSRILFSGFGFGKHSKHHHEAHERMKSKWSEMSEEEKLKFRENWRARCERKS